MSAEYYIPIEGAVWEWQNEYTKEWNRGGTVKEGITADMIKAGYGKKDGIRDFSPLVTPDNVRKALIQRMIDAEQRGELSAGTVEQVNDMIDEVLDVGLKSKTEGD